jgi:phospholipid-binding lipoprotein MlaA
MCGCASKPGHVDPFEKSNRFFYGVNNSIDQYALKPAADTYDRYVPQSVRAGIANVLDNLALVNVIANDLLQAQWNQALSASGRFGVNTTVGIAGIFDVATPWGMPYHDNRLDITLGKWGLGPGPYLVLPLLGPSSFRDVPAIGMAIVTSPMYWVEQPWALIIPVSVVSTIDARSRSDMLFRFRNQAAIDPYVFTRDAYMQYREALIHGGQRPPETDLYDDDLYGDDLYGDEQPDPATAPDDGAR